MKKARDALQGQLLDANRKVEALEDALEEAVHEHDPDDDQTRELKLVIAYLKQCGIDYYRSTSNEKFHRAWDSVLLPIIGNLERLAHRR